MLANNLLECDRLTDTCFDHCFRSWTGPIEHQSNPDHLFEPGSLWTGVEPSKSAIRSMNRMTQPVLGESNNSPPPSNPPRSCLPPFPSLFTTPCGPPPLPFLFPLPPTHSSSQPLATPPPFSFWPPLSPLSFQIFSLSVSSYPHPPTILHSSLSFNTPAFPFWSSLSSLHFQFFFTSSHYYLFSFIFIIIFLLYDFKNL